MEDPKFPGRDLKPVYDTPPDPPPPPELLYYESEVDGTKYSIDGEPIADTPRKERKSRKKPDTPTLPEDNENAPN